jgi:hypothetical protein
MGPHVLVDNIDIILAVGEEIMPPQELVGINPILPEDIDLTIKMNMLTLTPTDEVYESTIFADP